MVSSENFLSKLKPLVNRRIGAVALLGFASGLPLALSGGTLQAWMAVEGVDLKTIGLFTLVGLPYTLNFYGLLCWTDMCFPCLVDAAVGYYLPNLR